MESLSIVTGVWGDYGRFIPEWVDSIAAQTVAPTFVGIVDGGLDSTRGIRPALRTLEDQGIETQFVRRTISGMGDAMNRAVELTDTEWVIRLDADDTLLPHAIEDVERLSVDADVVAIGADRDGVEVLFPRTSTEWVLAARQGAMSPAAFRRKFWEKAPFITENDWIESVFWVGLAHQGARFVPTERAGFVYRQWPGSHSHLISRADKRAARAQHLAMCRR